MSEIKAFIVTAGGVIAAYFGDLYTPFKLLILCNLIDYITGLIAAHKRGERINSYRGIEGISKKICMWLLIAVGMIVDEMIKSGTAAIGIDVKSEVVIACIVSVWLICNEIISILENMSDIGVPMPSFMLPMVKKMTKTLEDTANEKLAISDEDYTDIEKPKEIEVDLDQDEDDVPQPIRFPEK